MADARGFIKYKRQDRGYRPVKARMADWAEVDATLSEEIVNNQSARCMDCGVPFCHGIGCPLANRIPEFNDLVYRGDWRRAAENLHSTNNFPEITGRVCPAPCEAACTLAINDKAVTIKQIECEIIERAFQSGYVRPLPADHLSDKRVAVVGSGPTGLAVAQELARAGHEVVVFEKDDRIGGLLRYGIPDFKLDKNVLDRRIDQMTAEGVKFEVAVEVGLDVSPRYLSKVFDAVCLCGGAGEPRTLDVAGADLDGVHMAMDYLSQQNRIVAGDLVDELENPRISAAGKHVVVIGGGDTGSDCVGTANRQGALSVRQLEILPQPPEGSNPQTPWPSWPIILRTSSSQEEGCERMWSVLTKELTGSGGHVNQLHLAMVDWENGEHGWEMKERSDSGFTIRADLVLVAMGFLHVVHAGLINPMGLRLDSRGNVAVKDHMTSADGVFAAGDTVRGASLVVHAIAGGRQAAVAIDRWLLKG